MTNKGPHPEDDQIVNSAIDQLRVRNDEREQNRVFCPPPHGLLFHYTTAEGLKGIIENNELWASSAYFMNDSSEVTYGYDVLKEVLDEWIKCSGFDDHSIPMALARDLLTRFVRDRLTIIHPVYLTCFCEDGNLLSQWRAYGQSGGYSLGFNLLPLLNTTKLLPEPAFYTSRLIKVEYDRAKQIERCRAVLSDSLLMFQDGSLAESIRRIEAAKFGTAGGFSNISHAIADILREEILGFKEKAFEVEKEWRLVVRPRLEGKTRTKDPYAPFAIHFRASRGLLIPYLKVKPDPEGANIPLEMIWFGPTIDKLSAVLSLQPFLHKHGFTSMNIRESGITARF